MDTSNAEKVAVLEDRQPAADIEKHSPSDSEDDLVFATKPGNDQDRMDMQRLGKTQQLNVGLALLLRRFASRR